MNFSRAMAADNYVRAEVMEFLTRPQVLVRISRRSVDEIYAYVHFHYETAKLDLELLEEIVEQTNEIIASDAASEIVALSSDFVLTIEELAAANDFDLGLTGIGLILILHF